MWNRRQFVTTSSLGLIGVLGHRSLLAQAPAQPPTVASFADVRRNISVFTARGGTIGFLVTPDAVVVVDSQFADTACPECVERSCRGFAHGIGDADGPQHA